MHEQEGRCDVSLEKKRLSAWSKPLFGSVFRRPPYSRTNRCRVIAHTKAQATIDAKRVPEVVVEATKQIGARGVFD
jgi:hypothetical protein